VDKLDDRIWQSCTVLILLLVVIGMILSGVMWIITGIQYVLGTGVSCG